MQKTSLFLKNVRPVLTEDVDNLKNAVPVLAENHDPRLGPLDLVKVLEDNLAHLLKLGMADDHLLTLEQFDYIVMST